MWKIIMYFAKKWPEIVLNRPKTKFVSFLSPQTLSLSSIITAKFSAAKLWKAQFWSHRFICLSQQINVCVHSTFHWKPTDNCVEMEVNEPAQAWFLEFQLLGGIWQNTVVTLIKNHPINIYKKIVWPTQKATLFKDL